MYKTTFEQAELEIIPFRLEDSILTSPGDDNYEGWNPQNPGGSGSGGGYEGWNPH